MNEKNKRIEELNELLIGEEEIIKELNKPGGLVKGYKIYYLLDNDWVGKYKNLIMNNNIRECKNLLNVSLIQAKVEQKDFSYIHEDFKFGFTYNFTLVTQNFMDLLCENFIIKEQEKLSKNSYKIIIGGRCLIIRDRNNENSSFACITLYNEKNKKFNNNVDYLLIIDDIKEMNKHLNFILKNNIWNYFKIIKYQYKDEYKIILNTEGKTIGYLILNNENIMQFEPIENRNNNFLNKNNVNMNKFNKNINKISTNRTKQILDQSINSLNEKYKDKINEELLELRKENNNLKKEIKELKEELNNEKKKNQKLNSKIEILDEILENKFKESNSINMNNKIINELYKDLKAKEREIKNIKSKFPFELSENEELMSVIFFSPNQKIHYSIICKNTDQFTKIETQLYKEYPDYGNSENYFIVNGNKINKYKSLKENNIKNSDILYFSF
jgi:hypothetical protein